MTANTMKVDDQAKIDLFQVIAPIVMQYLAANSPDRALIADDIIDFFALSIAALSIAAVIEKRHGSLDPAASAKGW